MLPGAEGDRLPDYPPREQLVLLNEELHGRAGLQSDELEGLDRKASTMLAGTGVVLAVVINNVNQFQLTGCEARDLFYGSLVSLSAALFAGVVALWPRQIRVIPSPRGLVERYYAKGYDETLANLVSSRLKAAELNKNISVGKVRALKFQMVLVALGGLSIVLAFLAKEWMT
jgi:hypothetical protein